MFVVSTVQSFLFFITDAVDHAQVADNKDDQNVSATTFSVGLSHAVLCFLILGPAVSNDTWLVFVLSQVCFCFCYHLQHNKVIMLTCGSWFLFHQEESVVYVVTARKYLNSNWWRWLSGGLQSKKVRTTEHESTLLKLTNYLNPGSTRGFEILEFHQPQFKTSTSLILALKNIEF